MTGTNKKMNYPKYLGIKVSSKTKEWLKEDFSKRIRTILEWCEESYPIYEKLLERILE